MRELSTVVLASVSPRRFELLRSLGLRVEVQRSDYEETELVGVSPPQVAAIHAQGKTLGVLSNCQSGIVIGADTVVDVDGVAFGKPKDAAEAAGMLRLLSGREHLVHTAIYVADATNDRHFAHTASTAVRFFPLDEAAIAEYSASGEPLDKAGAYGIQGRAALLVERIEGDFYTVMGFPLGAFARRLPELGYRIPLSSNEVPR